MDKTTIGFAGGNGPLDLRGVDDFKPEGRLGRELFILQQQRGEKVFCYRRRCNDLDNADVFVGRPLDMAQGLVYQVRDFLRLRGKIFAFRSIEEPLVASDRDLTADLFFDVLKSDRKRRLGNEEFFGGAGKAFGAVNDGQGEPVFGFHKEDLPEIVMAPPIKGRTGVTAMSRSKAA